MPRQHTMKKKYLDFITLTLPYLIIALLIYFLFKQQLKINDLEMVLEQCENAYYKKVAE